MTQAHITIGGPPDKIGFLNDKLYVTYRNNTTISVIDAVNNNIIKDLEVGYPVEIVVDYDRKEIYLINRGIT